jgi:hypothetical protein
MRSHTVTVETATTVHISSSWTKRRWHASADVYTFNRNTGLRAAAEKEGMSAAEQAELWTGKKWLQLWTGKKWLQLWMNVCHKVKATRGTCFVMARGSGPGDRTLEGNVQQGEVNAAELAGVAIEYVYY